MCLYRSTPSLRTRSRKQMHAYALHTVKNQDTDDARVYVFIYVCAGILDREHLLMPPRPPANPASFNARNGISEVFRRDRISC